MNWRVDGVRVRRVGDAGVLIELPSVIDPTINARAVAIAGALRQRQVPGVRDIVPTYRSVAVHIDPLATDMVDLDEAIRASLAAQADRHVGQRHEIPVAYGGTHGPDLVPLAASLGLTPAQLVGLHTDRAYRVYMLGFLPGFGYLGTLDARIEAPRHDRPRLRVPAGSVALAGRQTGIYPQASPGGWQLIGRTSVSMFDPARERPSLLAVGDEVRFVEAVADRRDAPVEGVAESRDAAEAPVDGRRVTVLSPGLFTTVQDLGRWGMQEHGVPVSGAMDTWSHRIANAAVGNPPSAAVLETTIVGPSLRFEQETLCATAGADVSVAVDGVTIERGRAHHCRTGAIVTCGARRDGARAYLAFDGGCAVPEVLGSRSTHRGSQMGGHRGRALRGGDVIPLGQSSGPLGGPAVVPTRTYGAGGRLRVLPGPQDDWFDDASFARLTSGRFTVAPQSDRMGYRLAGPAIPFACARGTERERATMISDATFPGAVQVTPSGDAMLLLADRQTTGGYPQIAVVISADLPRAGQLAPGDWVSFELCTYTEARSALVSREADLRVPR